MIVNGHNLGLVFQGFQSTFNNAFDAAPVNWPQIAMQIASASADENYGWLGNFRQLREWIGARHVHNLTAYGFTLRNKTFESTVSVHRNHVADDKIGLFRPAFEEMGRLARTRPEELLFGLLASGFATAGYGGQYFFDTDHPVADAAGDVASVSNMQAGAGAAWYLLDTSRGKTRELARSSHLFQRRVPLANVWVAACLHHRGWPVNEIARRLRISDLTVRRYIARTANQEPNR